MVQERDFNAELLAFLKKVFEHRHAIKDEDDVYDIYRYREWQDHASPRLQHRCELDAFLNGIAKLAQTCEDHIRMTIQGHDDDSEQDVPAFLKTLKDMRSKKAPNLASTFFHFGNKKTPHADRVGYRIYIHVAEPYVDNALKIVGSLIPHMQSLPNFDDVKVAGPANRARKDQIVVYFVNEPTRNVILESLKKLHKDKVFAPDLPFCIKQEWPGVGIADEPPEFQVLLTEDYISSYGSYIALVLWWCVDLIQSDPGDHPWQKFLKAAEFGLRRCGIDVHNPHKFDPVVVEELKRIDTDLARYLQRQTESQRASLHCARRASTAASTGWR
jgi:hypothetical protein